jgi:hypothetical protein
MREETGAIITTGLAGFALARVRAVIETSLS